jgi:hypothetical protein
MRHQGPDDSGIHITQLQCTSSMLSRGVPLDEVVRRVLGATRTAAGAAGNSWDWSEEEQQIEAMCRTWIAKHPEIAKVSSAIDAQPKPFPDWPEPDMTVLRLQRRPAPELPLEIFGEHWSRWIEDNAEASTSPVDYVAAPLLAAASAVIGHARWARAGRAGRSHRTCGAHPLAIAATAKARALMPSTGTLRRRSSAGWRSIFRIS